MYRHVLVNCLKAKVRANLKVLRPKEQIICNGKRINQLQTFFLNQQHQKLKYWSNNCRILRVQDLITRKDIIHLSGQSKHFQKCMHLKSILPMYLSEENTRGNSLSNDKQLRTEIPRQGKTKRRGIMGAMNLAIYVLL